MDFTSQREAIKRRPDIVDQNIRKKHATSLPYGLNSNNVSGDSIPNDDEVEKTFGARTPLEDISNYPKVTSICTSNVMQSGVHLTSDQTHQARRSNHLIQNNNRCDSITSYIVRDSSNTSLHYGNTTRNISRQVKGKDILYHSDISDSPTHSVTRPLHINEPAMYSFENTYPGHTLNPVHHLTPYNFMTPSIYYTRVMMTPYYSMSPSYVSWTNQYSSGSSQSFAKEARRLRKQILKSRKSAAIHGKSTYSTVISSNASTSHAYGGKNVKGKRFSMRNLSPRALNLDNEPLAHDINPNHCGISDEYIDDGDPIYECVSCGALMWYEETLRGSTHGTNGSFSLCCTRGKISLPVFPKDPPSLFMNLYTNNHPKSSHFIENIRRYNNMFSFTSMGGRIDHKANKGRGPYIFRLQGENCHRMGGLVPTQDYSPQFSQLYIYDTTNEIQNRINAVSSNKASYSNTSPNKSHSTYKVQPLDRDLVREVKELLDLCNPLVKCFRMARDRFVLNPHEKFKLKLMHKRVKDGRNYNLPTAPEIAALVPGDIDLQFDRRDILIESHNGYVKRISELHPQYLALQYPLLFVYAEDGYRLNIPHNDVEEGSINRQKTVTMREFFSYMIQHRPKRKSLLLKARKLLQQFLVDAYTMIESERISFIRNNQGHLRRESYEKLCKAAREGNTETTYMGTRVLLPSSFTGSSRYMVQNYLDAMALCKRFGYPDLFITFTCNPKWPEVVRFLEDEELSPEDRSDMIARMFKIKLDRLMRSIRDNQLFGRLEAYVYTVEFQKRGLPHAHICLFLHEDDKLPDPSDIDRYICAELPDKKLEPTLYKLVGDFMMHGPCGEANVSSPCMVEKKCSKNFPKKFVGETSVDKDGFPVYRRLDNDRTVMKSSVDLDNRYVVGHNSKLLKQYQAHINVEWCNQVGSIKYLFKYINKGPDRVTAVVCDEEKDEVQDFLDCRYVSSCEAVWRIYSFDIHKRHPPVERLPFHLPNEQSVIFDGDTLVDFVLEDPSVNTSKFLEWMNCNKVNAEARELTYVQFPSKFVWKQDKKKWFRRKTKGWSVGRIHHVSPTHGALFYLRILLNIVKGPTSFEEIKTVNGVVCDSYKEACYQLGLLDDDNEYIACIEETHKSATGPFLRNLFAMLLLSNSLIKPEVVWNKTWELLSEDLEIRERRIHKAPSLTLTPSEKQNIALDEIEQILLRHGRSLKDFDQMPFPVNTTNLHYTGNKLISDETMLYDTLALTFAHERSYLSLTDEQRNVYHTIMNAVDKNEGGVFFLYGFGGTGKTFVWKTLSAKIRSNREIVLNVASSGIAALLLEGGRTAHSRFAIPININESSFCCIRPDSDLAALLRKTKLIIWDEAPMIHKHSFEALDRTMRDILRESNPSSMNMPFGGKVVVFGGDFRQVLPVIPNASRQDIVNASLKSSYIWDHCTVLRLTRNMRLEVGQESVDMEEIKIFGEWILSIGNGKINEPNDGEAEVEIPDDILIKDTTDPIASIVDAIYPDINDNLSNANYFQDKAILAPTHEVVDKINEHIMKHIDGEEKIYLSSDNICASDAGGDFNKDMYSPDFLNGLRLAGLPNHQLLLKPGVPVMLIRNINQPAGLCNGTRLIVVRLGERVIEAKIISGSNIGETTFIPRMRLSPSDNRIPFKFQRRQFPLSVCFAMTINKSQGQTLSHVGLFLKKPVFSHGQLYVALSRVKSKRGLKVMICDDEGKATNKTTNVVFKEVLRNL